MASAEFSPARREPRSRAAGELLIELNSEGEVVHGHLLDVSPHGFSIQHDYDKFVPEQMVHVVYEWGKVPARLVWVGERDGRMAAGFRTD